jgi:peptidoglycan LD-endopeptidase CwlK
MAYAAGPAKPTRDLKLLAPKFRAAVDAAIAECNAEPNRLNAIVYETWRSPALQALYYQRGRTITPPFEPVTNAWSNLESWHGYGLAVDVIHATRHWAAGGEWFLKVARIFRKHGCSWGGYWDRPDLPHFQWAPCRVSPSAKARTLFARGGLEAVWKEVGAWQGE